MDERSLMARAASLAAEHHPHPNPRVGAIVLDRTGEIVGTGAHAAAGTPHAEALALGEAGARARGGTLIVTLEPCSHEGRTPPCTGLITNAGIARVVAGIVDPDERVSGRGIAQLRDAGVEVEVARDAELAESIDPGYFHHRRSGLPRVTLKMALTLDGQAAAVDGSSRWITSPDARRDVHLLRAASDAVMVGAGTAAADDPHLGVRLDGHPGPQPRPVIVAGGRPLSPSLQVFGRHPLVYSPTEVDLPGEVVIIAGADGVHLPSVIADLGKRAIVDLLVEGGPTLAGALIAAGLVDRYVVYLGGMLAGGAGLSAASGVFRSIGDAHRIDIRDVRRIGPDVRVEAVPT